MANESLIVIDTHVLVWWLSGSTRLSSRAKRRLAAACERKPAVASTISVLEIVTAERRGRLELSVPVRQWLNNARALPELRFEPVTADIAQLAGEFDETMHGDPADRLIAATAACLNAPLVTADEKLRSYNKIKTLW
ncbi:type II toxin-antitoxin system VapC family toxin [Algiphilus sp. W345]|uniref:Ribonuclease VapC n=1 Tax=Banduia mediterranea TaxID=3075609 RepID=A0ABU2WG80_9GAMM|nr:type II toxin-antitoxin system VapC family toxin [Algiphilus sp. W345]MDT0496878.1 type II toxin-antitoxin system VapC family toxin [Algiphilus sp. W345]